MTADHPDVSPEERDHTAALLAHWYNLGPELVEALKMARDQLREENEPTEFTEENRAETIRQLNASLTKANTVQLP